MMSRNLIQHSPRNLRWTLPAQLASVRALTWCFKGSRMWLQVSYRRCKVWNSDLDQCHEERLADLILQVEEPRSRPPSPKPWNWQLRLRAAVRLWILCSSHCDLDHNCLQLHKHQTK